MEIGGKQIWQVPATVKKARLVVFDVLEAEGAIAHRIDLVVNPS